MSVRMLAAVSLALAFFAAGQAVRTADGANAAPGAASQNPASSVATFNCLSLYWSPEGGQAGKQVQVKFRAAGAPEKAWHDGLPMRYNPIEDWQHPGHKTPECKGDYRGSIVNLTPDTEYEIALTVEGTDVSTTLKARTWSEKFPIGKTIKCQSSSHTLEANQSGTPEGYILYDGSGATIDTHNTAAMGIDINAHYVIIRGFTIKNVKSNGINITQGHHIVIENCDISKWGSEDPTVPGSGFGIEQQGGVWSKDRGLHAVVIQRCKIHNPSWNSNSWAQKHHTLHPEGPQTIVFTEPQGNIVIRYNECWSDDKHYFNDTMGGNFNGSYRGWPGADSDIYGNYIANCWDDGIEAEGGGQNVRIWDNYIENTMMIIANAATSIGPLYVWQNVSGRSYSPPGSNFGMTHGDFMKMGYADSVKWMTGQIYVFNNTILQPNNEGAGGLGGDSRIIKHCTSRNNILDVRPGDTRVIATDHKTTNMAPDDDNDFDYDLISANRFPPGSEKHAIKGTPKFIAEEGGFNEQTKTGDFALAPDSPGKGAAKVIPNFCDPAKGRPDMGAQQSSTPPMVYGVKAKFVPASERP